MKKIILVLMLVLLSTMVQATEGDIEVDDLTIYEDGDMISVDWDDDEFRIDRGNDLQIKVRLENKYNKTVSVKVKTTINDINNNDLKREESRDIDSDEVRSFVLDYYIPVSTSEGSYRLDIRYTYTTNGTDYSHSKDFDIMIEEKKITIEEALLNLTSELVEEKARSNDLAGVLINVSDVMGDLTICSGTLGELRALNISNSKFESLFQEKNNETENLNNKLNSCTEQKGNLFTKTELDNAKKDQKREDNNFLMIIVGIGGTYLYMKRKKEKVGGEGVSTPLGGTWK